MQKRAPTVWQLGTIVGFALSCFGILLFLWIAFGGPTPLAAKGYTVKVPFTEAAQLANQSDVRISGVSVGKVQKIELSPDGKHALATLELNDIYGPIPADTQATLRQKTLLGETYVELTPGSPSGSKLHDGGTLPAGQVSPVTQLDEIFRTFNPETRLAFQQWMQNASIALDGQGQALSNAFAELEPTFTDAERLLRVLDTQENAVRQLIANGGTVFEALSERQGQLRSLIQNSDRVFTTTARRNRELQETFITLPTFLDQSRATLTRLQTFAENTDPLVQQLMPAARELPPVVRDLGSFSRELDRFFVGLRPVVGGARRAFPALRRLLLADFPPLLTGLPPFLRQFNPVLQALSMYKQEVAAFFGNASAAINAIGGGVETQGSPKTAAGVRYLRVVAPLSPDALAAYSNRLSNDRANAYPQPLSFANLASGLQSFETAQCAGGPLHTVQLDPNTPNDPAFNARVGGDVTEATAFFNRIKLFSFNDQLSSASLPNVACVKQGPYNPIGQGGPATDYLHVFQQP
jgi:phospholipid/cholesterol/gamma-HCH transport system substrate-binding protein